MMNETDLGIGNFQECLRSYQKSMVFTSTAAFFLLLYTIDAQSIAPTETIEAGNTNISLAQAWFLALFAFVIFFCHAISCLNRANNILENLKLTKPIRQSLIEFPSFATHPSRWVRLGTVFLPTILVFASFAYEISNTWNFTWAGLEGKLFGIVVSLLMIFSAPIITVKLLKNPFGASGSGA